MEARQYHHHHLLNLPDPHHPRHFDTRGDDDSCDGSDDVDGDDEENLGSFGGVQVEVKLEEVSLMECSGVFLMKIVDDGSVECSDDVEEMSRDDGSS